MNHKQILDKLPPQFVEVMDQELRDLVIMEMTTASSPSGDPAQLSMKVVSKIKQRWNCVLLAPEEEAGARYKNSARLALLVLLHRYGFQDEAITHDGIAAIDALNEAVALSDAFERQTQKMKEFLRSPPVPLKRRPAWPKGLTQWRAGDVAAYQVGKRFYGLYVHKAAEDPLVEFYDFVSEQRPSLADLSSRNARGRMFNDGVRRAQRYIVRGLRQLPDPANQFHHLGNAPDKVPKRSHLAEEIGVGVVSNIFRLPNEAEELFDSNP